MPTARELLQQADALMRRNRAPIGDDDIPELTDVVPESALEHPAAPTFLEDVPEIAGSIDELRSAPPSETIAPEGEPSVWLDEPAMGAASITGEAPDSVLAVAPAMPAPEPDAHAPERDAQALEPDAHVLEPDALVPEPDAHVLEPDALVPEPDALVPEPDAQVPEQGVASLGAAPLTVPEAVAAFAADVRLPLAWDDIDAAPRGDAIPGPAPQAHPGPVDDSVVPSRGYGEDMARWEALAEEIRMQVLQRIDIFTDAGLKEQLNERLQPVVDRASAELVGTISLHVGQLLRAYVAEAIEREIDKWRQGGS